MEQRTSSSLDEAWRSGVETVSFMGHWVWIPDSDTLSWSRHCYQILGYDPSEVEPSAEAFFAVVHPEDVERVRASGHRFAGGSGTPPLEYRICQPDGSVRHVLTLGQVVEDDEGGVSRVLGTILDITGRHEREQALLRSHTQLEAAQAVARIGSWGWEVGTDRIDWSKEMYRITGIPEGTALTNALFHSLVHPEDLPRLIEIREQALRKERAESFTFRLIQPSGIARVVSLESEVEVGADGAMTFIGTLHDITDRELLQRQQFHSQKVEAIGRLAAGVAHDFNNLLTVIVANASILRSEKPSAELEMILSASRAASDLTRQLLSLGRRAPVTLGPIWASETIRIVARLLGRTVGPDIRVSVALADDLWPIYADTEMLRQILVNLAMNARDAMNEGGELTIFASNHNGMVRVVVEDNGVGMSEEMLSRACDPFFTTKDSVKGCGLGLSTANGLMEQMGGSMRLESSVGEGTRAILHFRRASSPKTQGVEGQGVRKETFIFVENDARVRSVCVRCLSQAGYNVLEADGMSAALALEVPGTVHGLITDVNMPGGSGPRLVDVLRERHPEMEVLFITGYPISAARLSAPVLRKPFTASELLEAVRAMLGG